MSGRPQHRVHGFNPALCKVSDEVLRAGELKEWRLIARACDQHLGDLQKHHLRSGQGAALQIKRANSNA